MDGGVLALGVDVGSTSTKVTLVRVLPASSGRPGAVDVLATRAAPTPVRAADLMGAVVGLVAGVVAGAPGPPAAVGIASMAESGVPLDEHGEALTEILRWDGARGAAQARGLAASLGFDAVFAATGVRLAAKTPLATWAWLREAHPGVVARTARWAGAADLVALALTGRLVTDHTLAGRTGAYLLAGEADDGAPSSGFDVDLLAAVGWGTAQMPAVARPGDEPVGASSSAFAAAGVPLGTPVVVAGHDHAVGAWAAGVRRPGQAADSLGTAEAVLTVLPALDRVDPRAVAAEGMSLVRTVAGNRFGLLAGTSNAGALVRWWVESLGAAAGPARAVLDGSLDPGPEPTGRLVLPYPSGRTCPRPDPAARLRLIGAEGRDLRPEPPRTDTALWTLALLEGLSLHAAWMLAEQAALAALAPADLTLLGGAGAASPAWVRSKAALLDAPVRLVAGEPVAAGAALLAAHRAGLLGAAGPWADLDVPVLTGTTVVGTGADAARLRLARYIEAATEPSGGP